MDRINGAGINLTGLVEAWERLRSVRGSELHSNSFAAVIFEFETYSLRLSCDDDTDETILTVQPTDQARSSPEVDSLASLSGSRLEYVWHLTNHRGYRDAVQLRFIDEAREEQTIQFEVAASTLKLLWVS